ncbi:MAG: ASKHA domain-containing protein [Dehalococcoidales bacterium]|nr:ASKHA domain-containing protein [Dehalococcoidales bacterium]
MNKFKIKFLPDNREVGVEEDTTILQAAEKAGVFINNLCGGEGLCGECRVQILEGNARPDKYSMGFFSAEELKKGYVLACQTQVEDNLVIMIPEKSRTTKDKILMEGSGVAYGQPEKVALVNGVKSAAIAPLVRKIFLKLPEPTMQDNISDIDRVVRELSNHLKFEHMEISLSCLQKLAEKLRDHQWQVTVTIAAHNSSGRILQIDGGDTSARDYGLAIDVGTTTVVVQLVNMATGEIIDTEGSHNMQARYGEDVISRMVFACSRGSSEQVHKAVITNINTLLDTLVKENKVKRTDIHAIVAAGNTTMAHFLLNLKPCSIRLEPYVPTATVYPQVAAHDLAIKINRHGVLETVPSVASYVGGDIVAGVLACGMSEQPEVRCLIDIGTNGEIVIGNSEWLVCCSASAGPAFEGAGAKHGMRASQGAIEKIVISEGGVSFETIGKTKARGICGSGLIDAIYELVKNKIIEQDGKFNLARKDPRLIPEAGDPRYILAYAAETEAGEDITISESEIANLIKSKGAVFAAIKSLTDYVGWRFDQLETVYVAGGFGSSLNIPKAIAIGLLPDIAASKIQFIGNSSLTGARMILLSTGALEKSRIIARRMTNIELSNYPPFMNEFIAALFLPHTDARLFPSVDYGK